MWEACDGVLGCMKNIFSGVYHPAWRETSIKLRFKLYCLLECSVLYHNILYSICYILYHTHLYRYYTEQCCTLMYCTVLQLYYTFTIYWHDGYFLMHGFQWSVIQWSTFKSSSGMLTDCLLFIDKLISYLISNVAKLSSND